MWKLDQKHTCHRGINNFFKKNLFLILHCVILLCLCHVSNYSCILKVLKAVNLSVVSGSYDISFFSFCTVILTGGHKSDYLQLKNVYSCLWQPEIMSKDSDSHGGQLSQLLLDCRLLISAECFGNKVLSVVLLWKFQIPLPDSHSCSHSPPATTHIPPDNTNPVSGDTGASLSHLESLLETDCWGDCVENRALLYL